MLTVSNDLRFLTIGQQQMFELLRNDVSRPGPAGY
jgi:hypothetical protein